MINADRELDAVLDEVNQVSRGTQVRIIEEELTPWLEARYDYQHHREQVKIHKRKQSEAQTLKTEKRNRLRDIVDESDIDLPVVIKAKHDHTPILIHKSRGRIRFEEVALET